MISDSALLRAGTERLRDAGVGSPEHDARLLLEFATDALHYDELIDQRAQRIPLQHITNTSHFRHLALEVGPGVFLPRPETELLCQEAIDTLSTSAGKLAVDLCAGSGAVALSLATEVPGSTVHAIEIDLTAYGYLRRNVDKQGLALSHVGSTVVTHPGDATDQSLLSHLYGTVDVVASNPPYIPDAMIPRDPEARDYDPAVALFGGADGLDIARGVVAVAHDLLVPGGLFVMEHADVQGESVTHLFDDTWTDVHDHLDYNNLPRYVTARKVRS